MKIIPFNYRGLASQPKKLALKQMILGDRIDVIFLQEVLDASMEIEMC